LVPAVEQANRILMYLESVSGAKVNLSEICRNVGILPGKGLALLNTLQKVGFVSRDMDSKIYSLGPRLVSLGQKALENLNHGDLARSILKDLARETRCTALFGVISGEFIVVTALEEPTEAVVAKFKVGHILPLFYRAQGVALASVFSEEEQEKILRGHNASFKEEQKGFDPNRLRHELDVCRQKGFALDISPHNPMVKVLVSPVLGIDTDPIGCLYLIGVFPKSGLQNRGRMLAKQARKLSALLSGMIV